MSIMKKGREDMKNIKICKHCGQEFESDRKRKYCFVCSNNSSKKHTPTPDKVHRVVKSKFFGGLEVLDDIIGTIMLGKYMRNYEYGEEGVSNYLVKWRRK